MLDPAALAELGFGRLTEALAHRAQTPLGRERCLALPLLPDLAAVELHLSEVEEARGLLRSGTRPPFLGLGDLSVVLARAQKQGALEGAALLEVAAFARGAARLRGYLEDRAARAPNLAGRAEGISEFPGLAQAIEAALEPSGRVADTASSALRHLRERARELHQLLRDRLDELIKDEHFQINLRESYLTIRNGRYCVPVLAQFRAQVPGIVHNSSQSGQTLFIEPQPLIGPGNDLAVASSMAAEEEHRILVELTARVGRAARELRQTLQSLAEVDELFAGADLSEALAAERPVVTAPEEPFVFVALRHPLLALQHPDKVVASDVALRDQARALILSGPNGGGKTVTLSAIGLCTAMVRAGLPIPAQSRSRVPLVRSLFAAVGDAQDLARGLSTFSAHLAALRQILAEAIPGSLVLIDEIAADTDPREGAALAAAVLESLVGRRALVVATTHLDPLKALALGDPRFTNAAVGFDPAHHRPTYRLVVGQPGSSSALAMARRAGLPDDVVARAEGLVSTEGGPLGTALRALEEERDRYAQLQQALARDRSAVLDEQRTLAERTRVLVEREAQAERTARAEVLAELAKLRAEAGEILKNLRGDPSVKAAGKAQHALAELAHAQETAVARPFPTAPAVPVEVGQRVRSLSLGLEGKLLAIEGGEGLVALGALKTRRALSDLAPAARQAERRAPSPLPIGERVARATAEPLALAADTLDLRGLRTEEALREAAHFLDRAFAEGRGQVNLVHGHGTGALKAALREFLAGSRYVRIARPGGAGEGGEGVTVVDLAT